MKENIRQYIERLANILPNTENLTKQNYVEFMDIENELEQIKIKLFLLLKSLNIKDTNKRRKTSDFLNFTEKSSNVKTLKRHILMFLYYLVFKKIHTVYEDTDIDSEDEESMSKIEDKPKYQETSNEIEVNQINRYIPETNINSSHCFNYYDYYPLKHYFMITIDKIIVIILVIVKLTNNENLKKDIDLLETSVHTTTLEDTKEELILEGLFKSFKFQGNENNYELLNNLLELSTSIFKKFTNKFGLIQTSLPLRIQQIKPTFKDVFYQ